MSWRSSSWSRIEPAAADEPKSERPKRAPSSSAQLTRRTGTGGVPSSAIRRSTSTPATTFRDPSSQPPFGTESRWPPISSGGPSLAPPSVNHWLPASSISSTAPVGATCSRSHAARGLPGRPSTPPAGRRSRPPSARGAPRARRRCGTDRAACAAILSRSGRFPCCSLRPRRAVLLIGRGPSRSGTSGHPWCGLESRPARRHDDRRRRRPDRSLGALPLRLDLGRLDVAVRRRRHLDAARLDDR